MDRHDLGTDRPLRVIVRADRRVEMRWPAHDARLSLRWPFQCTSQPTCKRAAAVGLPLGTFVRRRSIALALVGALWPVSIASIAARGVYSLGLDADNVGVLATLVVAVLGC